MSFFDCGLSQRGVGSFGKVYRGLLPETGEIVAVKHLDIDGSQGHRNFLAQILTMARLNHTNLINLIGYCIEGEERLLVHEYLPVGSLHQHLHDRSKPPLDWYTRMKIALGVASALEYVHHKADPPVIYLNLKPSNILLDNDFNVKLSDFGLAKFGPFDDKERVSVSIKGTSGYIAPKYEKKGHFSEKADVYSFGVFLLELVSGRRAIDITRPTKEQNLVSWARRSLDKPKKLHELADPLLQGHFPAEGFKQALAVADMCLQKKGTERPMMSDVVNAILCFTPINDLLV